MATENHITTFKQGEVGKKLRFTLEDADGLFDLTPYLCYLTVRKGAADPVMDRVGPITKLDQTANKGECEYALTALTAAIAPGTYDAEVETTDGINRYYWPVDKDDRRTYFTVKVQKHL